MLNVFPGDAEAESEESLEDADKGKPCICGEVQESIHPVWHPRDPIERLDQFIDAEVGEDESEADG